MRDVRRANGDQGYRDGPQEKTSTELEKALDREAEQASRHLIRLSLMIAAILREKGGTKKATALLARLNEKGYILLAPVVQVAEFFNQMPDHAREAFERGFLSWEWLARFRRSRRDQDALLRLLQDLENRAAGISVARPPKPARKPDLAAIIAVVRKLVGRTIGSADADRCHVVLRADDATQFVVSTTRSAPIMVEIVEPGYGA